MTLTPQGYRPRLIDAILLDSLKSAGAVNIEGPKSCGKTWCARNASNSEFSLVDPKDNFLNMRIAKEDPSAALEGEEPHLIDEWQDVPKIWDAVRFSVDTSGTKGRYILCGSSSTDKSKISHSGAARIVDVRMHTMSSYESGDSDGKISLRGLFDHEFKASKGRHCSLNDIAQLIVRGGWPGLLESDERSAQIVLKDYINKACEVDALKTDGKARNIQNLKRAFRSLARNESTLATKSKITRDIAEFEDERIDEETVAEYMAIFGKLHLIEDQTAFAPNYRSPVRVGKNPKRHLADPSLAAAAMGLDSESLIKDTKTMGFLFEALCERDLRVYCEFIGAELFHYRDHSNREIDAVVELKGSGWGAFEIKVGQGAEEEAAESLKRIYSFMEKDEDAVPPKFMCIITGTGGMAYRRDDGIYVVPINMLGP